MTAPTPEELTNALNDARARYVVARDERNELILANAQLQQQLAEAQQKIAELQPQQENPDD
ncbi:MAG: hypothetical protein GY856_37020 [bacterium]|nr:hypothetical protein [bacterium]